ncbi:MAG: flagellar hook-basal body complex protein, partial [Helicobacter sp.]|nr:flagellar hook-basal body complex protein [Helicobacter sp.]
EYNNDKKYKEGDVVVLDGKIYQRSNPDNDSIDEDNPPVDIQDSEIGSPLQTPSFWKEIGDLAFGEFKEYQAGSTYQANSFVLSDGKLYQKINGEGNTNPLEDKEGWRRVSTKAINTTSLQVPTYQTNTEIYDDAGKKFILKNEYVLLEQGNYGVNPAVEERWEVRSSIYDHTGKIQISEDAVINELTFNAAGEATIPVFQVPFNGSSLAVDLSKSVDGKTSSNFAFGDSSVKSSWQNGTSEGALKSTSIDANGIIFVNFTNGKVEPIGRFGVAAFVNDQGLHKVGGNLFEMDFRFRDGQSVIASGAPIMAWEEDRSAALKYGRVLSNKLESSNVDTGAALTDLIIYQRGYQASAKSITTADQLLQEAIQLKRN